MGKVRTGKVGDGDVEPAVVDLWPEAGRALNLGKNLTYQAAKDGSIPTVRFGSSIKVPMWFIRQLRDGA